MRRRIDEMRERYGATSERAERPDPRRRDVVRRDGRRRRPRRPAHRDQRRRQPGRAARRDRRHRARGRGARPPALDDPGARAGARAVGHHRLVGAGGHRRHGGAGLAGSLLVGITMAKTLAWLHDLPLVPVNHLEGHIYAAWLLDPDEEDRPAPEFPLVALVVSGGHTFLVEMADHLRYRLLGQTVDDAAGEAFDKVGRLLAFPIRVARRSCARRAGGVSPRPRFPARGWCHTFDFLIQRPQDRRAARGGERASASSPADGLRWSGPARSRRLELAYGFQDSVVDVLASKTPRGRGERRADDRCRRRRPRTALLQRIEGENMSRGSARLGSARKVHGQR